MYYQGATADTPVLGITIISVINKLLIIYIDILGLNKVLARSNRVTPWC